MGLKDRVIDIDELIECPFLAQAEAHKRDVRSPFRRIWECDNLIPIRNSRLDRDKIHHYRRLDENEIEQFYAMSSVHAVA